MSTYSQKLLDPRWQRKRLEIMERDGFKCSSCITDKHSLRVHHRYYVTGRNPWEYPNWSLRTLCKECHDFEHDMELHREENNGNPRLDQFEDIMGFLVSGIEADEDHLFDIAAEISMIAKILGRANTFGELMRVIHPWRIELQNAAQKPTQG